ncbi:hypothetical protein ACIBEJ_00735 [Nonomuraea sp. NPDC050790]|uniref:hypothetical protein n=1 Tax=Nonomuraea sp. NPDC050790 TaxID=3364371 RepID=UPI0037A86075
MTHTPVQDPLTHELNDDLDHELEDHLAASVEDAMDRARDVRAELLHRSLAHAAHLIRRRLPDATAVTVDISDIIPANGDGCRAYLHAVHSDNETLWHRYRPTSALPDPVLNDVAAILTDALRFAFTEQELTDLGWDTVDGDDGQREVDLPDELPLTPAMQDVKIAVFRYESDGPRSAVTMLFASPAAATAALAAEVRERWYVVGDILGQQAPDTPPQDNQQAIDAYFAAVGGRESYCLQEVMVPATVAEALAVTTVWLLQHDDDARTPGRFTVHSSYAEALAELAARIRASWHRITSNGDAPTEAPADDEHAVEVYFAFRTAAGGEESYDITDIELSGPLPPLSASSSPHS